tara:strand:- start:1804 stop:2718 length:915 start_codon:yes stop_codon:yes gene_type:complete
LTKKKIILFGGSGFIGFNLVKKLKEYKFDITSVSRKKIDKKFKLNKIKYLRCDVSKYSSLKKIKSDFDYIINLSGNINHRNTKETIKTHFLGTKNLIDFFEKKKFSLFIQMGSSLEYGDLNSPHLEKSITKAKSNYGKSKLKATKYIKKRSKIKKFSFMILRLYQIYGPYQKKDRLIPYVINSSIRNKSFNCTDGNQLRDFLYIDDFTLLILKILKKKNIKSGIFNVGFGKPQVVKKVINLITKNLNKGTPLYGKIKMRKEEKKIYYPNIQKIKKNFNWKPKIKIPLGIKKTINFYEKNSLKEF